MSFYVEHHSWRRKNNKWSGNIVRKFFKLTDFEKYVIATHEKYPDSDITYNIYECLDNKKGVLLSKLRYSDKKFSIFTISNKWIHLCCNNEKIIEKINT